MKQKTLLTTILIFVSAFIFAQDSVTVSGIVRDDQKQPLPGATVVVKGTTNGTSTDANGSFTLRVAKDAKAVIVSYVGYDNKEYPINTATGNISLSVSMASSDISLNQVVVSVSKRKEKLLDAPASITVIGRDKLETNVVTTPVDELKGTAGVDIMRIGLVSSNVVVRGFNDIFSGSVLNVVDDRIGSVPSLRVNAYQLIPTSSLDYEKIEVIRGPASALYGPNASSGVIAITTRDPLEQKDQFETTVAMTSGFTVMGNTLLPNATGGMSTQRQDNGGKLLGGNIINPEFRHSGRTKNGIFGYKISGGYFQGQDYPNYDSREPYTGDTMVFGSVHNGNTFTPDTLQKYTHVNQQGQTVLDSAKLDTRVFKKDFFIRKWNADARFDIHPTKDITITINGGISSSHNIELTGLGAGVAGGSNGGWMYWYLQAKFKWKRLFIQYFINSSDAGSTYLIPQLSASSRGAYPYQVQLLVDKSKLHVLQLQHSWSPISKLNFVYGADAQFVRPNTEGTINGLFEPVDYVNMAGIYLQGDYEPLKWLKLVAAFRADYNSIIQNVAASPRAAIVFKVADNQDIRITYNRAFDAPNTLDQFLDLAQTQLPNGMYARGIGNPYGYNYSYDPNGNIQYKTAPWGGTGSWVNYNSTAGNVSQLDSIMNFMIKNFAGALGNNVSLATSIVRDGILDSIRGTTGTVSHASLVGLNLNTFGATNNYQASLIPDPTKVSNLKKINNQYTQTVELGYKGFLFRKLSIQVDGYWTRINNYVSALTPGSEAVALNAASYLGPDNWSGQLYRNLYKNNGALNNLLLSALDGQPSLQNPTITPSIHGSVWDELTVLLSQLPIGAITPNSKYVNSDYILTYENLGRLDVFGIDFGAQYNAYEDTRHSITVGGSLSWVDKDQFTLSTGQSVSLNAPKVKGSVTFDHILKKSGFGYGLMFRSQMAYDAASSVYVGHVSPCYILDAKLSYRLKWYKKMMVSVNVNNLTNYQWSAFPGAPVMGTQVYFKAQITF